MTLHDLALGYICFLLAICAAIPATAIILGIYEFGIYQGWWK